MNESAKLNELKKLFESLEDGTKDDVLEFVRIVKGQEGYDYIEHFLEGFNGLMENASVLMKINELIGDELDMIVRFEPEEEQTKNESDWRRFKERSDLLVRFARMLRPYDMDTWTSLVKARFEKGLDDLEKLIGQGDLSDKKTEGIRSCSNNTK